jgi:hypothetical protein
MTPLPDIHLKDIGREKEGILPAEAFSKILESLYKDIASSAVIDTLNTRLKFLGWSVDTVSEGTKKIEEEMVKEMEKDTDKIKGIFK